MELTPAARTARQAPRLATGTRLGGGRYTLGNQVRSGVLADLYEATDSTTGNAVSIHVLDPRLVQGRDVVAALNADVQAAQALSHKNIATVIELAVEGPHTYVVTDLVEGHSLRELIDRKRETGTVGFGAKGALNIVTHVAAALSSAADAPHGGLTLDAVAVSRAGRVRVSDFGLSSLVAGAVKAGRSSPGLAPEVVAGGRPTAASDVYGLGALLYEILVGAPPVKGCKRPSEAVPGVPASVDAVIGKSMNAAPEKRYPDVESLRAAITAALAEGGRPSMQMTAQAAQAAMTSASSSASLAESLAAGGSGQMGAAAASGAAGAPAVASAAVVSMAQPTPALMAAMQNTEERWLISKGKLDFGPYTLAVICEQIQTNQILPGHVIIDKDTGGRKKVEDHPLLFELVEAAKQKRDEARRTQAEVQHATSEKRRGAALYLFIGVGVLALGGGVYLLVTKLSADKKDEHSGAIVALEGGSLQAKISFPSKAERARRAKSRRGGGKASSGGPGGPAWDDSLNLDMSDDESEDGGSDRLSDSDVNPVIQRHGSGLARCLTSTGTHNANIEFHVKPDGHVSQSRVNGSTGSPVATCIRGVMAKMQFPTFNGVRSKHEFDIAY